MNKKYIRAKTEHGDTVIIDVSQILSVQTVDIDSPSTPCITITYQNGREEKYFTGAKAILNAINLALDYEL